MVGLSNLGTVAHLPNLSMPQPYLLNQETVLPDMFKLPVLQLPFNPKMELDKLPF